MTPWARWEAISRGHCPDRMLFLPAIYDCKAALAGTPGHLFGQTLEELQTALQKEIELFQADAVTVGYDIYNVEAEAAGCSVLRRDGLSMPQIENPLIEDPREADCLPPAPSGLPGRMSLFVEAAAWAVAKYGDRVPVRGAVSGPFSMAATLCRRESILAAVLEDPEPVAALLDRCVDWILRYARAFVEAGAGVVVFDSFASPPMVSPAVYRSLILPFHQRIFGRLQELGLSQRPLILGGNTASIVPDQIRSGASQFLLDFNIPLPRRKELLRSRPDTLFRINLPPGPIAEGTRLQVESMVEETCRELEDCRNCLIGTGILPCSTPADNIIAIRQVLERIRRI